MRFIETICLAGKETLLKAVVLLMITFCLAATANALLPSGIAWIGIAYETVAQRAADQGMQTIEAQELYELIKSGDGVVVLDARPFESFEQGHVPGAICLPWGEAMEAEYPAVEMLLPRDAEEGYIVVYCSGEDCDTSLNLGEFLTGQGFENVMLFEGGMTQWREMQLPEEVGTW